MKHQIELVDAVGKNVLIHVDTLDEAMGQVGPKYPIKLDGIAGHLTHEDENGDQSDVVRFVKTEDACSHVQIMSSPSVALDI